MPLPESFLQSKESIDFNRRFSGLGRLYGSTPAQRVQSSHVVIVGIGGVGSWTAEALARSGVGRLTLIDLDHIAESNVNRQIHALTSTVGMAKIEAMRQRIEQINPLCIVECVDSFVDPENWLSLFPDSAEAVVDACDKVKSKTALAHWARTTKKIFISVGAAGGKRHAHRVKIADLSDVTHDPLLSLVRYQLRKHHLAPKGAKNIKVACVFSDESVSQPDAACFDHSDGTLNCHGYGSLVTVTATFGMCAAGWIMDKISQTSFKEAN